MSSFYFLSDVILFLKGYLLFVSLTHKDRPDFSYELGVSVLGE